MRLVIIGCGKSKIWDKHQEAGSQKAEDVYTSSYATVKREYAQSQGCDWMILSAKYGFIRPEFVVPGPYNVTFDNPSTNPISLSELERQVEEQDLGRHDDVTVIGGRKYIERTRDAFARTSVRIDAPFEDYSMGQQMHIMRQEMQGHDVVQRREPTAMARRSPVCRDGGATGTQSPGMINTDTFRMALQRVLDESPGDFVDVNAKELYAKVGGGKGKDYRMPECCHAMKSAMKPGDEKQAGPPSWQGAKLTIQYILPR